MALLPLLDDLLDDETDRDWHSPTPPTDGHARRSHDEQVATPARSPSAPSPRDDLGSRGRHRRRHRGPLAPRLCRAPPGRRAARAGAARAVRRGRRARVWPATSWPACSRANSGAGEHRPAARDGRRARRRPRPRRRPRTVRCVGGLGAAATACARCARRRRGATAMLHWLDGMGFELAPAPSSDAPSTSGDHRRRARRDRAGDRPRPGHEIDFGAPESNDYERLARAHADVRAMRPADLPEIVRIDRGITGRDRSAYIGASLAEAMDDSAMRVSLAARVDDAIVGFLMARADLRRLRPHRAGGGDRHDRRRSANTRIAASATRCWRSCSPTSVRCRLSAWRPGVAPRPGAARLLPERRLHAGTAGFVRAASRRGLTSGPALVLDRPMPAPNGMAHARCARELPARIAAIEVAVHVGARSKPQ